MGKWGTSPRKCCEVFLSHLVVTVKRSVDEIFMHHFHNLHIGFCLQTATWAPFPEPAGGLGDFCPRPLILPTPGKTPEGAYDKMMMSDVSQVAQLTYMLSALLHDRELTNSQNIQAYFLQGLTWSLGAALLEDGRVKFDAFVKYIATMLLIEPSVALAGLGR